MRSYVKEARRRAGPKRERIGPIVERLKGAHPDAAIALRSRSELELLVAVMLSAQTTDVNVNRVTEKLFVKCRKPEDYLAVPVGDLEQLIKPTMHHVNLKTTKLQEMIDWYGLVLGAKVNFQNPIVAFISNDRANHRIALLAVPGLHDDPQKFVHTGLYHTAFEYASFADLMSTYARLKKAGIDLTVPAAVK